MHTMDDMTRLAGTVAELASRLGRTVAVAESLTSGKLATTLGAAPGASDWFHGGVVAYSHRVKYDVLGVRRGPVICAEAAAAMALGVQRLTGADLTVAVTGAGGPGPEEGRPAGTIFLACAGEGGIELEQELRLDGEPSQIVDQTVHAAVRALVSALTDRHDAER